MEEQKLLEQPGSHRTRATQEREQKQKCPPSTETKPPQTQRPYVYLPPFCSPLERADRGFPRVNQLSAPAEARFAGSIEVAEQLAGIHVTMAAECFSGLS